MDYLAAQVLKNEALRQKESHGWRGMERRHETWKRKQERAKIRAATRRGLGINSGGTKS
jgi:hypothetical protein